MDAWGERRERQQSFCGVEIPSSHLHLEIDVESDPISGAVSEPEGTPHRFTGWIELVAAIERARASADPEVTLGWVPGANGAGDGYLASQMVSGRWGNKGAGPI